MRIQISGFKLPSVLSVLFLFGACGPNISSNPSAESHSRSLREAPMEKIRSFDSPRCDNVLAHVRLHLKKVVACEDKFGIVDPYMLGWNDPSEFDRSTYPQDIIVVNKKGIYTASVLDYFRFVIEQSQDAPDHLTYRQVSGSTAPLSVAIPFASVIDGLYPNADPHLEIDTIAYNFAANGVPWLLTPIPLREEITALFQPDDALFMFHYKGRFTADVPIENNYEEYHLKNMSVTTPAVMGATYDGLEFLIPGDPMHTDAMVLLVQACTTPQQDAEIEALDAAIKALSDQIQDTANAMQTGDISTAEGNAIIDQLWQERADLIRQRGELIEVYHADCPRNYS